MLNTDPSGETGTFDAQSSGKPSSKIVRRNFSLLERNVELLDEMAAKEYAGNKSACLRAAIEDHARSLEGETELEVKKLAASFRELEKTVEQIQATLEEDLRQESTREVNDSRVGSQSSDSGIQYQVYELIPVGGSVSLSRIASKLDESLVEVERTLEILRERGLVNKITTSESIEYEIDTSGVASDE